MPGTRLVSCVLRGFGRVLRSLPGSSACVARVERDLRPAVSSAPAGGLAQATAVRAARPGRGPLEPNGRSAGPLAGLFCCRSGRRKWASCPFFVSGTGGGRMKDKLFGLLEPVVAALGYELLDVEWSSAGRHSLARVYIDRTDGGGIGLDDCEDRK